MSLIEALSSYKKVIEKYDETNLEGISSREDESKKQDRQMLQ